MNEMREYGFRKFSTRDYILCGIFGALITAVMMFTFPIVESFGPGMAFINALQIGIILVLGALIINKFGTGTLIWTISTILLVPLPLFGPPGIHKIGMGLLLGFLFDIFYYALRKRRLAGIMVGISVPMFVTPWLLYLVVALMGLPTATLAKFTPIISVIVIFLGVAGAGIAVKIHGRLMRRAAVRSMLGT